jgi:hypothetical protein
MPQRDNIMGFISIIATTLLVGVAVWLWRLSKAQMIDISLETLLFPTQEVTASPLHKPSIISVLYRAVIDWLSTILPFVVLVWLVSSVVGSIYFLIKGYVWAALILALLLLLLLLQTIKCKDRMRYKEAGVCEAPIMYDALPDLLAYRRVEYVGEAALPMKVYVGDSHSISINLKPTFGILQTGAEPLRIQDTKSGKLVAVQILRDGSLQQFLEIELLAAGLEVGGEKKQQQTLTSQTLSYRWNCYFPNSGNHTLSLILRLVSPSGTIELGAIQHNIKVVKLDHLTQRQVGLIASLAGIVAGGLAIAEVLHQLGVW